MTNLIIFFSIIASILVAALFIYRKNKNKNKNKFNIETIPAKTKLKNVNVEQAKNRQQKRLELQRRIQILENELVAKSRAIEQNIAGLKSQLFESWSPAQILGGATNQEISNIAAVLAINGPTPDQIVEKICETGSHGVATLARSMRKGNKYISYQEVLFDCAKKFGLKVTSRLSNFELEKQMIESGLNQAIKNAPEADRKRLISEIYGQSSTESSIKTAAYGGGAIALANVSGFGLYTAASTLVAGITGAVGITLPFAAYTGMSSLLSLAIGPVGWAALVGYLAYTVGSPNYKKTIPSTLMIATIRIRLIAERARNLDVMYQELRTLISKYKSDID